MKLRDRDRDNKDGYIRIGSKPPQIPTDISWGETNLPTISSEWYQIKKSQEGGSSTQNAEKISFEGKNEETIEQNTKTKIKEGVVSQPEPEITKRRSVSSESPRLPLLTPVSTTFSFAPDLGDPKIFDVIDPKQANALFGSSKNIIFSRIETTTLEPIVSLGLIRGPKVLLAYNFYICRNPIGKRWDC